MLMRFCRYLLWEPLQRRWVLAITWPAAAGSPLKRSHKGPHRGSYKGFLQRAITEGSYKGFYKGLYKGSYRGRSGVLPGRSTMPP